MSFGIGGYGRLGTGETTDRYTATLIGGALSSVSFAAISAGWSHSLGLTSTGALCFSRRNQDHTNLLACAAGF